jgi:preprotein translocase subunit SecG
VNVVRIVLQVLLVLTSAFMTLLILMHKGKGGGLSDMFGGGMSSNLGSSGVAEKNLNRITVAVAGLWLVSVILLDLVAKYATT